MSHNLESLLAPLAHLRTPGVEEICLNTPHEAWVWNGGFQRHAVDLDAQDMEDIAICAGALRRQDVGADRPLLSTDIPGVGRLQAVLPPCVAEGRPSLTLRIGAAISPTLEGLAEGGLFRATRAQGTGPKAEDAALLALYDAGDWPAFLAAAVRARKSIVICGEVGSGKTTTARALIDAIPREDRIVTIEDTAEWVDLPQPNRVALYYAKGGKDASGVGASDLVDAALRMRMRWLLVQEIRDGAAAMAFLLARQSGHPGITTIHAASAEAAFDRLRIVLKQTPAGAAVADADANSQLRQLIDVVVHQHRDGGTFGLSEVWFAPATRRG